VKYTLSEETHTWTSDAPGGADFSFDDYRKLIRQGDVSSPLGGDGLYVRIFVQLPLNSGSRPDVSISDCR
jgi:hypothetical protein